MFAQQNVSNKESVVITCDDSTFYDQMITAKNFAFSTAMVYISAEKYKKSIKCLDF